MSGRPRRPQAVACGELLLVLACPRCGEDGAVTGTLGAILTVDENGDGSLRPKIRAKPTAHSCGQIAIPVHPEPTLDEGEPWIATGGQ